MDVRGMVAGDVDVGTKEGNPGVKVRVWVAGVLA